MVGYWTSQTVIGCFDIVKEVVFMRIQNYVDLSFKESSRSKKGEI